MKENSREKIFEKINQYADLRNKDVLEIGCGGGRITAMMAGKPETLVAIDPDEKKIKDAGVRIKGVDFQIGSGEKTSFADNSFDLVIFTLSLHHQNSRKAIAEAGRVLKENGRIIVVEPLAEGELERVFALLHNENKEKEDALNAIKTSSLELTGSETFSAEWIFENEDDLYESVFDYYEMPFDSKTAENIRSFLGDKIKDRPIALADLMVIQSLKLPA